MAISAPSTDRPTPTTIGSMLATAMRVAGTVPENITTASAARARPDTGTEDRWIPILGVATIHAITIEIRVQLILLRRQ